LAWGEVANSLSAVALDGDTVLWALRGLPFQGGGASADELARFLAKDATLSEHYSSDDVSFVLESLVAAGDLTYAPAAGEGASDGNESTTATMLYRPAACPEPLIVRADGSVADGSEGDAWDRWLRHDGANGMHDLLDLERAEHATSGVGAETPDVAEETETAADARARVDELERARDELERARDELERERDELERERDSLVAECDDWRGRTESAAQAVSRARCESDELRIRVRELERRLDLQRALDFERSEATRRTAAALARARHELERLEPSVAGDRAQPQATRPRPVLKGNWLQ
jgi:hypothetical protein